MVDVHQAAARLRARAEADAARSRLRGDELRALMVGVAAMLRARFGVTRVVLFGSLARRAFGLGSDVDLAVSGLANADYWSALSAVGEVLGTEDVDLVRIEEASVSLLETLAYEGVEL